MGKYRPFGCATRLEFMLSECVRCYAPRLVKSLLVLLPAKYKPRWLLAGIYLPRDQCPLTVAELIHGRAVADRIRKGNKDK